MQLYKIANDYAQLMAEDFEPDMIADTVEAIEGEISDKIEQLLAITKNKAALAEALKKEADALNERAKSLLKHNENIKQYIIQSMTTMEKKRFNAGIHTLTVRAPSVSVKIDDVSLIPPEYVEYVTEMKPDKNAIKQQLKSGAEIEGAHLELGKPALIIK